MNDPENDPCINGPKLAAWLRERDRLPVFIGETGGHRRKGDPCEILYRTVDRWARPNAQVSLEAADRWLTFIGCHLSELPDDFWEEKRKRPHHRYTPEERNEILRLCSEPGAVPAHIAQERGISAKTVWSWRNRAAA